MISSANLAKADDDEWIDDAIIHLSTYGSVKGHIFEMHNDENDDRWFMEVADGSKVRDGTGDIQIKKCWWLKSNSITERDLEFPKPLPCYVDRVKACGPPDCFTVSNRAKAAVPLQQVVLATVKAMAAKRKAGEEEAPPKKKGMTYKNGAWHIPL